LLINSKGRKKIHKKAIKIHEKGHKYARKGDDDQALRLYHQAMELANSIDDLEVKAHALCNMAQLLANKSNFVQANSYITESIELLKKIKSKDLKEVIQIYQEIKDMQTTDMFHYLLNSPKLEKEFQKIFKNKNISKTLEDKNNKNI